MLKKIFTKWKKVNTIRELIFNMFAIQIIIFIEMKYFFLKAEKQNKTTRFNF